MDYAPTTNIKACACKKGEKQCAQPTAKQIAKLNPSLLKAIMNKNKKKYM